MNREHKEIEQLQVPAAYDQATDVIQRVIFALADLGQGTAGEVVKNLERMAPEADPKQLIATTHEILTELYKKGLLGATDKNGELCYNIKKH